MRDTTEPLRRVRVTPARAAGVALLLIVVGGAGLRWARPANPSLASSETPLICTSSGCLHTFAAYLRAGDRPACPACGAAAVPAASCPNCGRKILLNRYVGGEGPTFCRHCNREYRHEE